MIKEGAAASSPSVVMALFAAWERASTSPAALSTCLLMARFASASRADASTAARALAGPSFTQSARALGCALVPRALAIATFASQLMLRRACLGVAAWRSASIAKAGTRVPRTPGMAKSATQKKTPLWRFLTKIFLLVD